VSSAQPLRAPDEHCALGTELEALPIKWNDSFLNRSNDVMRTPFLQTHTASARSCPLIGTLR